MSGWWLYRAFSSADELLYVGITKQGMLRLAEHQRHNSMWVDCFARFEVERFDSELEARQAEREAIKEERPRDNIAQAARTPAEAPGAPPWDLLDPDIRAHAVEWLRDQRRAA